MANGCKYGPAAVAALDVGESAGLDGVPLIDAAGSLACDVAAADASADFIECIHAILFEFNYLNPR